MNNNIVEEIKSRCNIVDVIGKYVTLKRVGGNYKGICPFHNEKTPSFVVSEQKQIFTCFGCGATGDAIGFVERIENLDFLDAIEKLGKEYGIDTSKSGYKDESLKMQLYEINRFAARFFFDAFAKQANPGYTYMINRGIDIPTLKKFGIGYADEKWDSMYRHLKDKGIEERLLLDLGLVSSSKGKTFDKFRNRIMFPIINTRGRVIGFGGRILGEGMPKYLNSQESAIFQKKNNLYGLNLARQDINKNNCVILVEGYMDVISLHKAGIGNTVASLGTALTESQGKMLKRYTNNIILAYDSDEAGQNATTRGIELLRGMGCNAKVLQMDKGKDPDEYVKTYGKNSFMELVENALTYGDYMIKTIKAKHPFGTPQGNIAFIKEVKSILLKMSPVEMDVYIKQITRETGISEGAIRRELAQTKKRDSSISPGPDTGPKKAVIQPNPKRDQGEKNIRRRKQENLERNLIKLMLVKGDYIPEIRQHERIFMDSHYYPIFKLICSAYSDNEEIDIHQISDSLNEKESELLQDIWENIHFVGNEDIVLQECLAAIEFDNLKKREEEILDVLSLLNEETDGAEISQLLVNLIQIQADIQEAKIKNGV